VLRRNDTCNGASHGFVPLFLFLYRAASGVFVALKSSVCHTFISSGILDSVEGECYRFPRCHWQLSTSHNCCIALLLFTEEIFTQAKRENFEIPDSLY
jgi:hypothetical protein